MKQVNDRYNDVLLIIMAAAGLLVMLLFGGCMTNETFYQDVRLSRSTAYKDWSKIQSREQDSKTQISGALAMQDSLKLAMLNNNELMAVVQQREIAKGKVVESYSAVLPSLTANAGYTRKDDLSGFTVAGQRITMGELDNYSADLQVKQPIYRGGAISAALRAARLYELLSDEQVRAQLQMTLYETASAYFNTLLAQELYKVNEDAVRSAESQLTDIKAKRGQGMASEFDVLRAEVSVSNFRAEMIQQKNRISVSKTRLLKAMGVIQSDTLELSGELSYAPASLNLDEAVKTAYENRADLYISEYELRLQKEAIAVAKSDYWPQVNGVFTQGWSRPDPHSSMLDQWGDYWTTGVMLEWPLFSGFGREGRIMQEQARYRQKQYLLKDVEQKVFLEVQQAMLSLQDAEEFVDSQKLNFNRAGEGLRLAEVGFREGVNTQVEVNDARAALTLAQGLYFQSLFQHTMARLNLQLAMGILGPKAGQKQNTADMVRPGDLQGSINVIRLENAADPNQSLIDPNVPADPNNRL
jgi:outer membrane protein